MHAASDGQPHGVKCLFLQGLQHPVAAQGPLRAATRWSSNSQRTQLRAGALASPFRPRTGSPLTIKLGVRSLHFWWPLSPAGFSCSKPDLTPVNRPPPGFFPHSKSDFYETEEFIHLRTFCWMLKAANPVGERLWLQSTFLAEKGRSPLLERAAKVKGEMK